MKRISLLLFLVLGIGAPGHACKCDDKPEFPYFGEKRRLRKKAGQYETVLLAGRVSEVERDSAKRLSTARYRVLKTWKGKAPEDTLRLISNGNGSCAAFLRDTLIVLFNGNGANAFLSMTTFPNRNLKPEDLEGIPLHMCGTIPVYGDFLFDPERFARTLKYLDRIIPKAAGR